MQEKEPGLLVKVVDSKVETDIHNTRCLEHFLIPESKNMIRKKKEGKGRGMGKGGGGLERKGKWGKEERGRRKKEKTAYRRNLGAKLKDFLMTKAGTT